ncbi:hypothetical protein EJ04DRAFT_176544 [Polyplosphaeria fusca]|uniref:Rhodopsin domain-containing protein n=1 Tax=Polyplosphaeria fusca TaxID=682080 RepID=A0A9P4V558_9PLEO|nr:hypothetical protein EJ04DRAFT_176544 [Polyplosphaeria fusca]
MIEWTSTLAIESWTLYALGVCLITSRIVSRRMTLGSFSKLQFDDYLMIFVMVPFTGTVVCANQVLSSSIAPVDETWHSKMVFALEVFQVTTTWSVKACLLILYRRIFPSITCGNERRYLLWLSVFCAVTYLLLQVLLPLWCIPVEGYWNSVSSNTECATYHTQLIITLAFSLSTALAVFILPIPFIPTPRKLLLGLMVLLGIIILASGVLGRYHRLEDPSSTRYLVWYCAEAASSVYFANLPFLNSLFTSNSPACLRHMNSRLSLSRWPCSIRVQTTVRIERLSSNATATRPCSPDDVGGAWSEANVSPSTPMAPILSLRPSDPPPELEEWIMRPSTRGTDTDTWSRRPSTRGTDGASFSRRPSRCFDAEDWSRRPSVKSTAEDWSRRPSVKSTDAYSWSTRPSLPDLETAIEARRPSAARLISTKDEDVKSIPSITSWYHAN